MSNDFSASVHVDGLQRMGHRLCGRENHLTLLPTQNHIFYLVAFISFSSMLGKKRMQCNARFRFKQNTKFYYEKSAFIVSSIRSFWRPRFACASMCFRRMHRWHARASFQSSIPFLHLLPKENSYNFLKRLLFYR